MIKALELILTSGAHDGSRTSHGRGRRDASRAANPVGAVFWARGFARASHAPSGQSCTCQKQKKCVLALQDLVLQKPFCRSQRTALLSQLLHVVPLGRSATHLNCLHFHQTASIAVWFGGLACNPAATCAERLWVWSG